MAVFRGLKASNVDCQINNRILRICSFLSPLLFKHVKDRVCDRDVVSVICFGVRVSVMFHFMFVHYTFSSVWVAEWPPFGK